MRTWVVFLKFQRDWVAATTIHYDWKNAKGVLSGVDNELKFCKCVSNIKKNVCVFVNKHLGIWGYYCNDGSSDQNMQEHCPKMDSFSRLGVFVFIFSSSLESSLLEPSLLEPSLFVSSNTLICTFDLKYIRPLWLLNTLMIKPVVLIYLFCLFIAANKESSDTHHTIIVDNVWN